MHTLKKLRPDHWAWINAKLAIILWAVLFFFFTPFDVVKILQYVLTTLISFVMVFGVGVSIVGLLMSVSKYTVWARRGTNLEISGLAFAMSGPLVYLAARVYLIFSIDDGQGIPIAALAYAVTSLMFVRIVIVIAHRKRVSS